MIFRQYTEIAWGNKTQTRRIVHEDEFLNRNNELRFSPYVWNEVKNRRKWYIGQKLAVIPKIYHPAIIYNPDHPCYGVDIITPFDAHYAAAREGDWNYEGQGYKKLYIRITGIRQEHLQELTEQDAIAEGFVYDEFAKCYQTSALPGDCYSMAKTGYKNLWHAINKTKKTRWDANPLVWVIDFERVQ